MDSSVSRVSLLVKIMTRTPFCVAVSGIVFATSQQLGYVVYCVVLLIWFNFYEHVN